LFTISHTYIYSHTFYILSRSSEYLFVFERNLDMYNNRHNNLIKLQYHPFHHHKKKENTKIVNVAVVYAHYSTPISSQYKMRNDPDLINLNCCPIVLIYLQNIKKIKRKNKDNKAAWKFYYVYIR